MIRYGDGILFQTEVDLTSVKQHILLENVIHTVWLSEGYVLLRFVEGVLFRVPGQEDLDYGPVFNWFVEDGVISKEGYLEFIVAEEAVNDGGHLFTLGFLVHGADADGDFGHFVVGEGGCAAGALGSVEFGGLQCGRERVVWSVRLMSGVVVTESKYIATKLEIQLTELTRGMAFFIISQFVQRVLLFSDLFDSKKLDPRLVPWVYRERCNEI